MTLSLEIYTASLYLTKIRLGTVCSAQEKCATLYNTRLIQFARIPAEFVVRFIRYQYRVKVIAFSMAASYLLSISLYSLRVQCLELYTACILDR